MKPPIALKAVVLPAPLGPIIVKMLPRSTLKLRLSTAVSPPKRTVRFSTSSIAPTAVETFTQEREMVCE